MAAIHWTVGARRDLQEIVDFIGKDSIIYAAEMGQQIISAIEKLTKYPKLGRIVPEYGLEYLRELILRNYRVVYLLHARQVGIIAIVHASRDLLKRLNQESWDFE